MSDQDRKRSSPDNGTNEQCKRLRNENSETGYGTDQQQQQQSYGQIVRQGELQNTDIRELNWRTDEECNFGEQGVKCLQSIYPNLTGIDLNLYMPVPVLLDNFPQLQKLSIVSIRDTDIIGRRELQSMPSLQKLSLMECDNDLTLHYICHMFPNLIELSIRELHTYDKQAELTISAFPSVQKRLLKDLPVPPLKRLVIEGTALEGEDLYDDFIFRFDKLESIVLAPQNLQWIGTSMAAFPNIEVLDLQMLFSRSEDQSNMIHLLDILTSRASKLKMVQYFSTSPLLFDEFTIMRERYPQLDFYINDESKFVALSRYDELESESDSDDDEDDEEQG